MLEPRRLLTFREVARRGSFSRAADALALTQPAVSQQVAALEREVGTPLLRRGRGGRRRRRPRGDAARGRLFRGRPRAGGGPAGRAPPGAGGGAEGGGGGRGP